MLTAYNPLQTEKRIGGLAGIEPASMNYTRGSRMFMTAQSGLVLLEYGLGRN